MIFKMGTSYPRLNSCVIRLTLISRLEVQTLKKVVTIHSVECLFIIRNKLFFLSFLSSTILFTSCILCSTSRLARTFASGKRHLLHQGVEQFFRRLFSKEALYTNACFT